MLNAIDGSNPSAADELLPLMYEDLRRLAALRMAAQPPGQTLQPTAPVHEAVPLWPPPGARAEAESGAAVRGERFVRCLGHLWSELLLRCLRTIPHFLTGKDKDAIAKDLAASFKLIEPQAAKIVRRITGRVRLYSRVFELVPSKK